MGGNGEPWGVMRTTAAIGGARVGKEGPWRGHGGDGDIMEGHEGPWGVMGSHEGPRRGHGGDGGPWEGHME